MIQKDPLAFTIRVMIGGTWGDIDLSNPLYEKQVLAAAGRFQSVKRKTRTGGHNGGRKIRNIQG